MSRLLCSGACLDSICLCRLPFRSSSSSVSLAYWTLREDSRSSWAGSRRCRVSKPCSSLAWRPAKRDRARCLFWRRTLFLLVLLGLSLPLWLLFSIPIMVNQSINQSINPHTHTPPIAGAAGCKRVLTVTHNEKPMVVSSTLMAAGECFFLPPAVWLPRLLRLRCSGFGAHAGRDADMPSPHQDRRVRVPRFGLISFVHNG